MSGDQVGQLPLAPRRSVRDYARDGWEVGGAALAVATKGAELRKFAAGAYAGVAALELADAATAVAFHHDGTLPERVGFVLVSAYVVALVSNLAAVGLAGLANEALDAGRIRPADGWRLMWRRLPQVAGWAVLVVGVGIPARLLTSWGIDQLAAVLLGFGWAVVSFFAIPAIALAGDGPIGAGIRSLGLAGRQWGTQVVGMVYVWLRPIVYVGLPGGLVTLAGVLLILEGHDLAGWAVGAAGVLAMALAYLLVVTANSILSVALYRFARGQALPREFDTETLERVLRRPAPRTMRLVRMLDCAPARRIRRRVEQLVSEWPGG
jgi:hypothetical protein